MIDSHCHLAGEEFDADRADVVDRARGAGLTHALCVVDATEPAEFERARQVRQLWPAVRLAAGVHPHRAAFCSDTPGGAPDLVRPLLLRAAGFCAVGEIGLDYHYDFAPRDVQRTVFASQVRLALELGAPVIIHTREADEDTLRILADAGQRALTGVFHCFSGEPALAEQAVRLGFHVSFSGIITFKKADAVRDAARLVPLERLLIETDSPYLAPVPHRGKRNEPALVVHVAEALAAIKGVPVATLVDAVTMNFERLFPGIAVPRAMA